MKNKKGSLVIEASVALTAFMFFILFFTSFAQIYRAQSVVSHATFQTAQSLAVESFSREKVGESGTLGSLTKLMDFVSTISGKQLNGFTDAYRSLGSVTNLNAILKDDFAYSIGKNESEADAKLKSLGITGGISGIDFSGSSVSDKMITVKVAYKVKLQFAFFGAAEITLHKTAQCKAFA